MILYNIFTLYQYHSSSHHSTTPPMPLKLPPTQVIVQIIISYTEPNALIPLFETHNINKKINFNYNLIIHTIHPHILSIFPSMKITGWSDRFRNLRCLKYPSSIQHLHIATPSHFTNTIITKTGSKIKSLVIRNNVPIRPIIESCPNIIRVNAHINISTLGLFKELTNLKYLTLDECPNLTNISILSHTLHHLKIHQSKSLNLSTLQPNNLRYLTLTWYTGSITPIFLNCQFLRSLTLDHCSISLHSNTTPPHPLKTLNLLFCRITQPCTFLHLTSLSKLKLIKCQHLTTLSIFPLDKLKKLTIYNAHNHTISDISSLSFCPSIKCLIIHHLIFSPLSPLFPVLNSPKLELLSLSCYNMTTINSLSKCINLKYLHLNCPSLSLLPELPKNNNIIISNLRHCSSLESINELTKCPNLRFVDLYNCTTLTKLCNFSKSNLQFIDLSGCSNLTNAHILILSNTLKYVLGHEYAHGLIPLHLLYECLKSFRWDTLLKFYISLTDTTKLTHIISTTHKHIEWKYGCYLDQ